MRLLELEINNLRGIPYIKLTPNGQNFLVFGSNGSGKSTIVDALDFLLTGQISRMTGRGTKDIRLKDHGPHIDFTPADVSVKGLFEIDGLSYPVEIKRSLDKPRTIFCDPEVISKIKPILEMADRGQHVLTRREILNYVASDAHARSDQIQKLLKINEVEKIRKYLLRVKTQLKNKLESAEGSKKTAEANINATIGITSFNEEKVLEMINENRNILGGEPIFEINSFLLKKDIKAVISSSYSVNVDILESDVQNICQILSKENKGNISKTDEKLRSLLAQIYDDPRLKKVTDLKRLTELGLVLIDEKGNCPLCGTDWNPGELKENLENQLDSLKEASKILDEISRLSSSLNNEISTLMSNINEILDSLETLKIKDKYMILESWIKDLKELSIILENVLENYHNNHLSENQVQNLFAPENIRSIFDEILSSVKLKVPEATPKQTAWEMLIRLEENLKVYEEAQIEVEKAYNSYKKAETLVNSYVESMESVLGQLYNGIKDRFEELYIGMHEEDENNFRAEIIPQRAGLDFRVDFHGRGVHPPNALHSEGHQDTMGICLYLALAESITEGLIDLIILDDVMMSVDNGHRRKICKLLANSFKGRQFFITTHDKTWARQLRSEGVVTNKGMIELFNWTLESGPAVGTDFDIWDKIEDDLMRNDVSAAAAKLRRGSEEFFRLVCDSLQAPVKFKESGQYELGDLLPAALGSYNKLLKKAKTASRSWENFDELSRLEEIENNSKEVFNRRNGEQWAINANVHYNEWADFDLKDFEPVVEAFQDLFRVFQCENCEGMIHVSMRENTPEAVRCNCGSFNWNLIRKR
ncbi:MAG: AAA family ATPase [Methanobacterium sp.]|nr:AAA family ATPase [Methanobacterium sp.]